MIPDRIELIPDEKVTVTIVPCPDCGSKNVVVVTDLCNASQGWSLHIDYDPLWQCKDCKRIYVRDPKETEYEGRQYYPNPSYGNTVKKE